MYSRINSVFRRFFLSWILFIAFRTLGPKSRYILSATSDLLSSGDIGSLLNSPVMLHWFWLTGYIMHFSLILLEAMVVMKLALTIQWDETNKVYCKSKWLNVTYCLKVYKNYQKFTTWFSTFFQIFELLYIKKVPLYSLSVSSPISITLKLKYLKKNSHKYFKLDCNIFSNKRHFFKRPSPINANLILEKNLVNDPSF